MRSTAKEWAERVRAWRESGQGASEFSAGKGWSEKTLRWWGSELERRSRRQSAPVAVARVVRMRAPRESHAMVVSVGAARIEVRSGFDAGLLRELVDALGARQ